MSQRTRVSKLEKKSGAGFSVAFLEYADADGSRLEWTPDMDNGAVQFIDAENLRIERMPEEHLADFDRRALSEARERLDVTVWLHPSARLV